MKRVKPRGIELHPGIRIDKIPVRGSLGLLFVAATLWIFLKGIPETRLFLLASVILGVIGAGILRYKRRM